ncbi:uncharacterized protein LOC119867479 isoform X2 [Canis lupus familiaris]|uniref:uncharacterized protein LOC119867479 isoform X2 n=2 Tax=Canis lupus familiaris TaxID=9615 RepID=UPI0018F2E320|nr:uncharacterized protein LOC119867479 isoform X2 [Canis lupus familiaris]
MPRRLPGHEAPLCSPDPLAPERSQASGDFPRGKLMYSGPRPHPPSTQDSPSGPRGTHVTASDSVHGQQVVAVAQLEADHTLGGPKLAQLLLWDGAAASLPDQVLQQQCVLAHALHRLQQVPQIQDRGNQMARATGRPFRPPRELLARLAPRAGKMSLHLSPMGSESSTAPKNSRRSCSRDVGCQGYTDYEIGHSTPLPGVEGHDGDRVPSPAQAFPDALDPIRKSCAPGDSGPSSVTARQFQGTDWSTYLASSLLEHPYFP